MASSIINLFFPRIISILIKKYYFENIIVKPNFMLPLSFDTMRLLV